jgi:acyl-CoA synthetase (AMP-forming)/AMP-acid ligase II
VKTLLETVSSAPAGKVLFAADGRSITAGQIRKTASEAAAKLPDDGLVYLHTTSASLFLAGLLAASRRGLTVGFPAHLQPQYLYEIGAERRFVLTDQALDMPSAISIALASDEEPATDGNNSHSLSLLFFTSGVTGAPKHVRKSIGQLDREANALKQLWGAQAGHVYATVSHQHIYGMLFRIFWPVIAGRVSEDRAADYWEHLAGKLTPETTLVSSPAHLTRLPTQSMRTQPALIFSSSAPLPSADAHRVRDAFGSLPIEVLGSTETGGIAWRRQESADTSWTPMPGVVIDTDDAKMLSVTSPFTDGETIATGDVVERVGNTFRLIGRADRIAKIEGKRVSLARVEEALLALPGVSAAAAIDLPDRKSALGAIVELNEDGQAALKAHGAFRLSRLFRTSLAGRLEPSERPKHWRFMPIPLDRQGKRVQSLLRARFADDAPGGGTVLKHNPNDAEIIVALIPDLVWFEGHFPEEPVLPGVAQVHLAVQWAERVWAWQPAGANLLRLKFRHILRPGDTATLSLHRDLTKQRLSFSYRVKDLVMSEGTVGGET